MPAGFLHRGRRIFAVRYTLAKEPPMRRELIVWLRPDGYPEHGGGHALGGPHTGGVNVLFCDDSLEFLPETVPPDIVRLLLLRDDREQFDWEDVIPGRIR